MVSRLREKGTGAICRNGPEGALHKWCLSPFPPPGEKRPVFFLRTSAPPPPYNFRRPPKPERRWPVLAAGQTDPLFDHPL